MTNLLLSEEHVHQLAATLLHFLWQGVLLGAIAWGALLVLAPCRAQIRYAIYCGLLLLLVASPVATFIAISEGPRHTTSTSLRAAHSGGSPDAVEIRPTATPDEYGDVPRDYVLTVRVWLDRGQSWLVALWLIGIAAFGIRLALSAIGVWSITRSRHPLPTDLAVIAERLTLAMAFRVRPAVYVVEQISQAMAVGIFKPMVLLPAAWILDLSPQMLQAVLAHELAHLRRWDLPINFLQRLAEALLFFHPVVWWCSRQMRIARELCCDERALQAIGDRVRYAEALTFLAEQQQASSAPLLTAGIGGPPMVLLERIRNVLGISVRSRSRFYGPTCALVGAAAASIVWLAILYSIRSNPVVTAGVELPSASQGIGLGSPEIKAPPAQAARSTPWPAGVRSLVGAEGAVLPSENKMVTLPEYSIEPPDVLFIEAIRVVPKSPHHIQTADVLSVQMTGGFPSAPAGGGPKGDQYLVGSSGRIDLGAAYGEAGRVQVTGLTEDEAAHAIEESLRAVVKEPQASVQVAQSAGIQPITGEHLVAPDGTVNLGTYGRVYLAGMTLDEARPAIERHLEAILDKPQVSLSVFAYNSKVYYIVTEGQVLGDTIARFPITGNETVLDALCQVNGLIRLQNKQIWIARPSVGGTGCDAILPVNWKDITTGGATASNFQVLPGDRIFISETSLPQPPKSPTESSSSGELPTSIGTEPRLQSVVEMPVLEYVRYFGHEKVGLRALETETGLKRKDAFDPNEIRQAARKIESLYQAKGFSNVEVEIVEGLEPGCHGAVFLIHEGEKPAGVDISFEGNSQEIASDERLKEFVESLNPFRGVDPRKGEGNEDRLRDYYRSLGFFKARIHRRIAFNEREDRVMVTYQISEGPRYNVRKVTFQGNDEFPAEELSFRLALKKGPYSLAAMNKDIAALKSFYSAHGYFFADAIADLRFDLEPGVIDIVYRLNEGQRYRLGNVKLTSSPARPHEP